MTTYIIIQLLVHLVIGILGWAIYKKEQYSLISGFINRSKEEQEQLINNGYPQKTGKLIFYTAIISGAMLPFLFIWEQLMMVQLFIFIGLLLGGFFYLSKYEVPQKRKRSYWFSGSILAIMAIIMIVLPLVDWGGYEVQLNETSIEITGSYGDVIPYDSIQEIILLDEMPEVLLRTNGVGLPHLSKGYFKVSGYEKSKLFIFHESKPVLLIQTEDYPYFINSKDPIITKQWFDALQKKIN